MKKLAIAALCLVAVAAIASSHMDKFGQPRKVLLNGKPMVSSYQVKGQWFVALEDLAKAVGAKTTLEPYFKLEGKRLSALVSGPAAYKLQNKAVEHKVQLDYKHKDQIKIMPATTDVKIKVESLQTLQVAKGGVVSANVDYFDQKAFVPLADVIRALGARPTIPIESTPASEPIKLNQNRNCPNCILIGL